MFVPVVPSVPHTTVVNKNIVYSDIILTLKDVGKNVKVTSISNVEEFSLEICLKTIFESNPNVVFNTIQYSRNEKRVYFYTNAEISKKSWEDSKVSTYNPFTSSAEILEEIKSILAAEKNKNYDCISLYDVAKLIKNKNQQYDRMKDSYRSCLENNISNKYSDARISVNNFDYENNELSIGFKYLSDNYDKISFSKKNGDLFLIKSETYWGRNVFVVLCDSLSKLYDEFMNYKDFIKQLNYGFKSINSNFLIDIDDQGVRIFVRNPSNQYMKDFELSSSNYSDDYMCFCNSSIVISAFHGKEEEIFKRIFIKISDCPEWSQSILYETRQNQLTEEQRIEGAQRRLEIIRKIFPFLKR